jgi:hypothetical protein
VFPRKEIKGMSFNKNNASIHRQKKWLSFQKVIIKVYWALVAHPCNPSYSRSRDQEDCSSKPAQANSSARGYV